MRAAGIWSGLKQQTCTTVCDIFFADEPTSGLDAVDAALVMRVVRGVASAGRTVIMTIHQPSQKLFYMFDDLLLLQRGGWLSFVGPLGRNASHLVTFLQSRPGTRSLPMDMNPASWMLDVLEGVDSRVGEGTGSGSPARPSTDAPVEGRNLKLRPPGAHALVIEPSLFLDVAPSLFLDGEQLQNDFVASSAWSTVKVDIDAACTPAPGSKPYEFSSVYARSWFFQV